MLIKNLYYSMALDGHHLMRTHTTTNQKQVAIMEDSRERCHYHQGAKSPTFGDNIVGRGI
jgi:hypothetical protein